MTTRAFLILIALLVPAAAHADRVALAEAFAQAGIESTSATANAALLDEMIGHIADLYVEPRKPDELAAAAAKAVRELPKPVTADAAFKAATEALTKELDPHTAYLSPADMDDMMATTSGEFGGIGVEITLKDEKVTVVAPIDDTPAARAGLTAGDVITHVDGQAVAGLPLGQVVGRIRGRIGATVTLTLAR
ncbi:MAG TPA: PDZ domain-containing protein, partial [Candidatus Omnitrophota bacterium]|nr:PDZ domain-containing protein [Candidatus Omnitrophota bacterium]